MLSRISFVPVLLIAVVSIGAAHATEVSTLPEPVQCVLKRVGLPAAGLSVYVHEVGAAAPALAVNADAPRNPASSMKVLTTFAALEELGPAFQWKTEAYATGPIRNGQLDGDLYLKGYGDPYLVVEHFWRLLRGLHNEGLRVITGDLVLDQSHFEAAAEDPADFDNQPTRVYNVVPAALLVNFQAVNFRFEPQANQVRIYADPLPAHIEIDNRLRLTRDGCHGFARHLGMQVRESGGRNKVVFSGSYDAVCGENELFRVVSEPAAHTHGVFKRLWEEQGGVFNGTVREAALPANARKLYSIASPPLADIIRSVNKYSNNVMTRQLLLTLGAEKVSVPGTIDKGVLAVRGTLARRGLDFPELVLANGSGLSREERISTRHLGEVLLAAWASPTMPEFVSSLPIAALDGTMKRRLAGTPLEGRVHLKTGSLNTVRSMAGYVLDRQGRRVAVVALHNHPRVDTHTAEAVQDALLNWVYAR